jgi:hypothetical protein
MVLREFHLLGRRAGSDFVGLSPVGEVLVVGPDEYREDCPTE